MIKLSKPLIIGSGENKKELLEIEIKKEDFTAKTLIEAEREFLLTGGVFSKGDMEGSRSYLGYVASKIIGCRFEEIENLAGMDYLRITNLIKGFFDGLELENLTQILLGK